MTASLPPARLFVLLAREAPVGVILRRGPSDWVQMIHWDTKKDIFTPGQWFHGRIFENKCDLSPDGKLFIYLAHRGANSFYHPDYSDTWTAISKPPYFTALALWSLYTISYGGGLFRDNRSVWLNHKHIQQPHPNHPPQGLEVIQDGSWSFSMRVFPERMTRDGWEAIQTGKDVAHRITENSPELLEWQRWDYWIEKLDRPSIWYKRWGSYALQKHYFGYRAQRGDVQKVELVDRRTSQKWELSGARWADIDQQNRLILAQDGKIFSAAVQQGELSLTKLADFNAHKPESVETPAWAQRW
jgi:hypothetical protein